jgi:hypothetical protein
MTRASLCVATGLCLLSHFDVTQATLYAQSNAQSKLEQSYRFISMDEAGSLKRDTEWKNLRELIKAKTPTHVFIMSHGWNNTAAVARETYAAMIELMVDQRDNLKAFPEKFEPLIVGIHWPSQFPENEDELELIANSIAKSIKRVMPNADSEVKDALKKGMSLPFVGARLKNALGGSAFLDDAVLGTANIEEAIKAASYYQMRARAKKTGETGVRELLEELQAACPDARFHLMGHSFGCKVLLECLASAKLKKPVSSLVLLQGAVSNRCFDESLEELGGDPGAFAGIIKQVDGPIVVTFTGNDKALGIAFPHASQIAGQYADLPAKKHSLKSSMYQALGATGVPGIASQDMKQLKNPYVFRKGLNCVNADIFIKSHSGFKIPEVAWMIWAAVLRPDP